jgi:hypothetical protein
VIRTALLAGGAVGAALTLRLAFRRQHQTGAFLRSRVIMSDAGVTLIWAFRRYRFAWSEIKEITIDTGFRFWKAQVRSAEREHLAFLFPLWSGLGSAGQERFHEPPPHNPPALRKLCGELRNEWKQHRKAAGPSSSTGA